MLVHVDLDEFDLKRLVVAELTRRLGDLPIALKDVKIEVKSKQNYKSEWEEAAFRATYISVIPGQ